MLFLKIFVLGWGILIGAIVLNFAAKRFGVLGWYDFLNEAGKVSVPKALAKTGAVSLLFLFFFYPFFLGLISYIILKFFKQVTS